jgi:chromate reductase
LATASINRALARALIRIARPDLEFVEIPIKDLPLYSYDYDADYPAEVRALKDSIAAVDAVLTVLPRQRTARDAARQPSIGPWLVPALPGRGRSR